MENGDTKKPFDPSINYNYNYGLNVPSSPPSNSFAGHDGQVGQQLGIDNSAFVEQEFPPNYYYGGNGYRITSTPSTNQLYYGQNNGNNSSYDHSNTSNSASVIAAPSTSGTSGGTSSPVIALSYNYIDENQDYKLRPDGWNQPLFLFSSDSIRMGFLRKVFCILSLQLLITAGIIAFMVFHETTHDWMEENLVFAVASLAASLVLTIIVHCSDSARKNSPQNIILLGLLTVVYAVTAGSISAWLGTEAVIYGAGFVVSMCLALALFCLQSKWRFRKLSGFIVMTILFIIIGAVLSILMFAVEVIEDDNVLGVVLAFIGAYLLSFILVWVLSNIVNEKCSQYKISPEEYISAVLILYTMILVMFLLIAAAQASGSGNNNCNGGGSGATCCAGGGAGGGGYYHGHGCCWWGGAIAANETIREEERRDGENEGNVVNNTDFVVDYQPNAPSANS